MWTKMDISITIQKGFFIEKYDIRGDEYNRQPAEIDAHAYGMIYMRSLGIEILFNNLPKHDKNMVHKRT